jgi:hypothetical protein
MGNGRIMFNAELESSFIKIEIIGSKFMEVNDQAEDFIAGILKPEGISIEKHIIGNQLFLSIKLPSATRKVTVLVVDDNTDMALFYRRSTEKSRFEIIHIRKGLGCSRRLKP